MQLFCSYVFALELDTASKHSLKWFDVTGRIWLNHLQSRAFYIREYQRLKERTFFLILLSKLFTFTDSTWYTLDLSSKIEIFYTNLVIQIQGFSTINTRRPNKDPLEVKLLPVRPVGSPQFLQRNCGIGARTILNKGWSTPKIYVFIEIFIRIGRILKY